MWYDNRYDLRNCMTEAKMATLSIKESREFLIFQAFSQNKTYDAALTELEQHDAAHPDKKIFASAEEKKAMFDSYIMFKEAERMISRGEVAPDYDNGQVLERLKNVLSQKLPAVSREVIKSGMVSPALNKANVGRMMAVHAKNVKIMGKRELFSKKKIEHEQAFVGKSGVTGHSPYERVVSEERTYKRNEDIILERMLKESQGKDC